MKHNIKIQFEPNNNYEFVLFCNNKKILENNYISEEISFDFDIENWNIVMIMFKSKNQNSKGFAIKDIFYNNLPIGKTIYNSTEFVSSHPNYSKCIPCTDINLPGVWFLRFRDSLGKEIIRSYTNG